MWFHYLEVLSVSLTGFANLLSEYFLGGDSEVTGGVGEGDTECGLVGVCRIEAAELGEYLCWCWRNVSKYGMPEWEEGLSDRTGLRLVRGLLLRVLKVEEPVHDLDRMESKYREA